MDLQPASDIASTVLKSSIACLRRCSESGAPAQDNSTLHALRYQLGRLTLWAHAFRSQTTESGEEDYHTLDEVLHRSADLEEPTTLLIASLGVCIVVGYGARGDEEMGNQLVDSLEKVVERYPQAAGHFSNLEIGEQDWIEDLSDTLDTLFELSSSLVGEQRVQVGPDPSISHRNDDQGHPGTTSEESGAADRDTEEHCEKFNGENQRFFYWLPPGTTLWKDQRIYNKRHRSTGLWFMKSPEVLSLLRRFPGKLLWCYGPSGVGKTFLTSLFIQKMCGQAFQRRLAFIFLDRQQEYTQNLATILFMIAEQLETGFVLSGARNPHKDRYLSLSISSQKMRLESALGARGNNAILVFDGLDECNRSTTEALLEYLIQIQEAGVPTCQVGVLLTSSEEPYIKEFLVSRAKNLSTLKITHPEGEITDYILQRLGSCHSEHAGLSHPSLSSAVLDMFLQRPSFLWLKLQLDYILYKISDGSFKQVVRLDLEELYRWMFRKIDEQDPDKTAVAHRALLWVSTAKRPLRPKELVIGVAIRSGNYSATQLESQERLDDIVRACCGFLTVDNGSVRLIHPSALEFLLGSDQVAIRGQNALIAKLSIEYMLCREFNSTLTPTMDGKWQSAAERSYMFQYWDQHVRETSNPISRDLLDLLNTLMTSDNLPLVALSRTSQVGNEFNPSKFRAMFDLLSVDGIGSDSLDDLKGMFYQAARSGWPIVLQNIRSFIGPDTERDTEAYRLANEGGHGCIVEFLDEVMEVNSRIEVVMALMTADTSYMTKINKSTLYSVLVLAARKGHTLIVSKILGLGACVGNQNAPSDGSPLCAAAHEGHTDIVSMLLESGFDVNGNDMQLDADEGQNTVGSRIFEPLFGARATRTPNNHKNPLIAAAEGGHTRTALLLLKNRADINYVGYDGRTALAAAAGAGHIETAEMLLDEGAKVSEGGVCGPTPLIAAARAGHIGVIRSLLRNGASIDERDGQGRTALIAAAGGGHTEAVQELIQEGAGVNTSGFMGGAPLVAAAGAGHIGVIKSLLRKGASVDGCDGEGCTALVAAAGGGHTEAVQELIEEGAGVNTSDFMGRIPLIAAAGAGHIGVIKSLLRKGASVDECDGEGRTALIAAAGGGHTEAVQELIQEGAGVNTSDLKGRTPLIAAAGAGHIGIIRSLLRRGASVDERGRAGHMGVTRSLLRSTALATSLYMGDSALIAAAREGHTEIVRELIKSRAPLDIRDSNGCTALIAAAREGHTEIVRELIKSRASLDIRDVSNGCTALIAAAGAGHMEIVRELIKSRAFLDMRNYNGRTALTAAREAGHMDIFRELRKNGARVRLLYDSEPAEE